MNKDEQSMQSHFQRRPATALVTLGDRLRYRLHAGTGPDEGWILDELWVFHLGIDATKTTVTMENNHIEDVFCIKNIDVPLLPITMLVYWKVYMMVYDIGFLFRVSSTIYL